MYKNYYCYIMVLPVYLITIFMIHICSSWFSMWLVMEINLILFIYLLMFDKLIKYENLMMYYLIQSLSSYLYLMFFTLILFINSLMIKNVCYLILNLAIMMKMGFPPFMQWYIKLNLNLNWFNIFLMTTIHKLIPLNILMYINYLNNYFFYKFILILLMVSMVYSCISALNYVNLKVIISFSSIIQMAWILILLFNNEFMVMIYFSIYLLISLQMFFMFMYLNIKNLNDLLNLKIYSFSNYMFLMFSLLTLSGLPPFSGFMMKWVSIQGLYEFNMYYYLLLMIFVSLISMFFYLRVIFFSMIYFFKSKKLNWSMINLNFSFPLIFVLISWILYILLFFYEIL